MSIVCISSAMGSHACMRGIWQPALKLDVSQVAVVDEQLLWLGICNYSEASIIIRRCATMLMATQAALLSIRLLAAFASAISD